MTYIELRKENNERKIKVIYFEFYRYLEDERCTKSNCDENMPFQKISFQLKRMKFENIELQNFFQEFLSKIESLSSIE